MNRRELLPHDSPDLLQGPQGPIDWTRQPASDDGLLDEVKERLRKAWEEWLEEHGQEP